MLQCLLPIVAEAGNGKVESRTEAVEAVRMGAVVAPDRLLALEGVLGRVGRALPGMAAVLLVLFEKAGLAVGGSVGRTSPHPYSAGSCCKLDGEISMLTSGLEELGISPVENA
jgi:hypothetical protein